jgi:hypothetical protein
MKPGCSLVASMVGLHMTLTQNIDAVFMFHTSASSRHRLVHTYQPIIVKYVLTKVSGLPSPVVSKSW